MLSLMSLFLIYLLFFPLFARRVECVCTSCTDQQGSPSGSLQYCSTVNLSSKQFLCWSHRFSTGNISLTKFVFFKKEHYLQIITKHWRNTDAAMRAFPSNEKHVLLMPNHTWKGRISNLTLPRRGNWKCKCCFHIPHEPPLRAGGKPRREPRSGFIIPQDTSAGESWRIAQCGERGCFRCVPVHVCASACVCARARVPYLAAACLCPYIPPCSNHSYS